MYAYIYVYMYIYVYIYIYNVYWLKQQAWTWSASQPFLSNEVTSYPLQASQTSHGEVGYVLMII